jgi:putative ABC transport system permease protein
VGLAALLALLVGCAGVTPALVLGGARASGAVMAALRNATGLLAARSIGAGLSRTGTATAALALALAVTTGVGVMVGSFRTAVERWLAVTLTADVYISAPSSISVRADYPLPAGLPERLRRIPGVDAIATNRWLTVPVDGVPTLVMAEEPAPGRRLNLELLEGDFASAWPAFVRGEAVLISEPLAYKRRLTPGATVTLVTDVGPRRFTVAAVYRDYGSDAGALMIHRGAYDRWFRDRARSGIALYAAVDVTPDALVARVRRMLGPDENVNVRSTRALRETSLAIFDRTFEITSVLRLFALIVAAFGVAGALMALSLDRARELATLRALGATPAQVAKLTLIETGLLGGLAGVVAMPLGLTLSAFLVFVINRRSFGWTMPLTFDASALLAAPLLGVAAGLAGGLYPAWRAARVEPARALREE